MKLAFEFFTQLLPGNVCKRGHIKRDQRVVYKHIHTSPLFFCFAHHPGNIVSFGNICLNSYCLSAECWLSYNATLRALRLGYLDALWYRGGIEAWTDARLPHIIITRDEW